MAGSVTEVTDNNFQAEVIESDVPVLVDFWAPWCGPCRMVAPVVEEIAQERAEQLKVVKLNIDENQNTAIQFNVMSIPTLILFRNGQPAKTVIGWRRLACEFGGSAGADPLASSPWGRTRVVRRAPPQRAARGRRS
jgi:thioredoxin 1